LILGTTTSVGLLGRRMTRLTLRRELLNLRARLVR